LSRLTSSFFFCCSAHRRALHSFPTRRSSDLPSPAAQRELFFGAARDVFAQEPVAAGARRVDQSQDVEQRRFAATRRPHHRQKFSDRKSTRLNSSHVKISYAVFCLKKKKKKNY